MLTPLQAVKAYCRECSGGSIAEVKRCSIKTCPLYPYRTGHRPPKDEKQA